MPRSALILAAALCVVWSGAARGQEPLRIDPHLDSSLMLEGCASCHVGHGISRSPMLARPQQEVCLSCHDSQASIDGLVRSGALASEARPPLVTTSLAMPFSHPLSQGAFSRRQLGVVTCTSCHSPHRGFVETTERTENATGRKKLSGRSPDEFEFELCQECHGSSGASTQSLLDLSRLTHPGNRSFHPIESPATERAPSVAASLVGGEIDCTDCHGNSDSAGARGPHGSAVQFILRREYVSVDGSAESAGTYALCYSCHDRDAVLDSPNFPLHRSHVVDDMASCATCHSAHGSVNNRALIRFGEETFQAGVSPSVRSGELGFESDAAGSGACYLTCHGVDHAPARYGAMAGLGPIPAPSDPILSPVDHALGDLAPSPTVESAKPIRKKRRQ